MASTILWSACYVSARNRAARSEWDQGTGRFGVVRPASARGRRFLALLTLELDENHVQRFIANVLRGVRQRLAKQNFAGL